jgi:hypothetical protein
MNEYESYKDKIHHLYENLSYFDQYGGSVFLFFILILLLFIIFSYYYVLKNMQSIKDDWVNQRCNPKIIPFAGFINKTDNTTSIEYTSQNFQYCMQNILTSISGYALEPISYVTNSINILFQDISKSLDSARTVVSNIRSYSTNIAVEILGRVANIMVPLQQILIAFVDSMTKIRGILTAGLYTSLGTYMTLKSLIGAIVQMIIIILIILAGLIVGMWIIPFTWPIAIANTAIFVSISIPLAIIVSFMVDVLHIKPDMSIPSLPRAHKCFDENTSLQLNDGNYKKISDITVGDILFPDSIVTAKIKLNSENVQMFNLHGILVSSTHLIQYNNQWIYVSEHPDALLIHSYNKPYIYCLNTSKKIIEIEKMIFADWDEIGERDIDILRKSECIINMKLNKDELSNPLFLHKYLDGGFTGSTKISLENGQMREIREIKIGDKVFGGGNVYGIVEIEPNVCNINEFYLGNFSELEGGANLILKKQLPNSGYFTTLNLNDSFYSVSNKNKKDEKLYHLLTEYGYFNLANLDCKDYNSCLEFHLSSTSLKQKLQE